MVYFYDISPFFIFGKIKEPPNTYSRVCNPWVGLAVPKSLPLSVTVELSMLLDAYEEVERFASFDPRKSCFNSA